MKSLFSIKLWLVFIDKIAGALFIPVLIIAIFAAFNRKAFIKGAALRLFLIALSMILLIRFVIFFSGISFEERYLYSFVAAAVIVVPAGIMKIAEFLSSRLSSPYPSLTLRNIITFIIIATLLGCIAKGLNPALDKGWMKDIASTVKTLSPDRPPLIITSSDDERIAYYAGAVHLKFSDPDSQVYYKISKWQDIPSPLYGHIAERGNRINPSKWILRDGMRSGLQYLKDNILELQRQGYNVFVMMERKDEDFRKIFQDESVPFPLVLIKEFKDKKKRPICLYKLEQK